MSLACESFPARKAIPPPEPARATQSAERAANRVSLVVQRPRERRHRGMADNVDHLLGARPTTFVETIPKTKNLR